MTGIAALLAAAGRSDGLPDRAEIGRAITDVLSRAEFRTPEPTWWDRFKAWCFDLIGSVFRQLLGAIELDTALGKVIVAALVLALLAILGHIVWVVVSATKKEALSGLRSQVNHSQDHQLPSFESVQDALAAAQEFVAAGNFAAAMHALYRGALVWLDAHGQARFDPSKTPGDYTREIADAAARRSFAALIDAFEPIAWGGRPASSAAWERMRACALTLGVPS